MTGEKPWNNTRNFDNIWGNNSLAQGAGPSGGSLANSYFSNQAPSAAPSLANMQGGPTIDNAIGMPAMTAGMEPSLVNKFLTNSGIINADGQLFGLNNDTISGLGSAFSMGKGIFDMVGANKNFSLAKDYYKHQMGLQNEQAQMARDENARVAGVRSDLNASYSGVA